MSICSGDPHREATEVAGYDPFDSRTADAEMSSQLWDRDIDDRRVEDVHERPEHERDRNQVLIPHVAQTHAAQTLEVVGDSSASDTQ